MIQSCPVCLSELEPNPYDKSGQIQRCPRSIYKAPPDQPDAHLFECHVHPDNEVFSLTLQLDGFRIVWWPRLDLGEPMVLISKRPNVLRQYLFNGKPDFDWSKIISDLPDVRKKLRLWRTFE